MLLFLKYDDDYRSFDINSILAVIYLTNRSFDIDGNQNMEYGVHQSERMIVWTK